MFCTTELEPRKNIVTKKLAEQHPDWLKRLIDEQARVCALLARERALAARDRTAALITIAAEVIARYRRAKDRRALLDYDDLIDKTLDLFARSSAAWVLYKLDLGIDHVLIDEAQDTSPKQWDIIKTITSEFKPGGSRPNVKRTVFAVGDEKQSIFSFQGAAPHAFYETRRHYEQFFQDTEDEFVAKKFEVSFRSGEVVLGAVDQVYSRPEAFEGLTADPVKTVHRALPDAAPGLVELWPPIAPAERKEIEGWDAPFDTESETQPARQAGARASPSTSAAGWRAGSKAGDVLVLVRQRGPLFEAVIRALKNAGIPVAGADRLVLTEHIAVMDLMALADCLLLPDDDLALASVLRSPLFGLSDAQLFDIAFDRKGSLRASLRGKPDFRDDECRARRAGECRAAPHALRLLYPCAGGAARPREVPRPARAGGERRARRIPQSGARLRAARDAVAAGLRRLAARGAKRGQARHGDGARRGAGDDRARRQGARGAHRHSRRYHHAADRARATRGFCALDNGALVWATARGNDVGAMSDARSAAQQAARDEYRRLLYVAMTRAKERLVIAAAQGRNKIPDGCWYQLVDDALRELASASRPTTATARCCASAKVRRWKLRRLPRRQWPLRPPCRTGCAPTPAPSLPACAR